MQSDVSTTCRRCGSCCREGGPALHSQDLPLLQKGIVRHADLITVRLREPSSSPLGGQVEPAAFEFVKLTGTEGTWCCRFFAGGENGCTIYDSRPLECRLLFCQAPEGLLAVVGRETLTRRDLINRNDPVLKLMQQHDERCSFAECNRLVDLCRRGPKETDRQRLAGLLSEDLELRRQALQERGLPVEFELFIFGRPMFFSVRRQGIKVIEENGQLKIVV